MLSSKYSIDDMELYTEKIFANQKDRIYTLAKKLWEMKCDTDNNIKVEHDFYLKKFHLSKKNLSKKFDCVMIDEAQDSNEMVFDMMLNMKTKGIVIVGDQFQAMYQFRKAKNIMSMLEDAKEYKLTTSFRVSQAIANISNILLSDVYGIDFGMKGFNDKNKIVDKLNEKKPYMVLARTNATLFSECINAIDSGKKKLYFEGGFTSYRFNDILDCYNFSEGDYVNNSKLNKFDNYNKMVEYAEKIVLFGSSLRTDCREDSDVDFAVYANEDENSWLLGKDSELFVNGISGSVDYFQDYDMVYRDTSKVYSSLLNNEILRGEVIYERV